MLCFLAASLSDPESKEFVTMGACALREAFVSIIPLHPFYLAGHDGFVRGLVCGANTALRFSLMGQACCHGSTRVIIP